MLETLYLSMGFRFATVCLKDLRTGQYRALVSFADRTRTAPEGVPPDETSLIKALKSQGLAAFGSG